MAWDHILGHAFAKRLLQTHLASGQLASAYLLSGPDGVGKRRLAVEVAKALNCAGSGSHPCDACQPCGQIERGVHPDVHRLSPGGPSDQIKIDEIRFLLGRVALRPFSARVQVAILEGAERLTEEAANALLKALEEPHATTRFLLTTARVLDCLPTIVSRCQLLRCDVLPPEAIARILVERGGCEPRTAEAVARLSEGSVSRALHLLERWAEHQRVVARFATDPPVTWLSEPLPDTREEVTRLLDGMMGWLRDVAVASAGPQWILHREHADALRRQAGAVDRGRCVETAFSLIALRDSLEQFVSPRLVASLAREKWLSLLTSCHGS